MLISLINSCVSLSLSLLFLLLSGSVWGQIPPNIIVFIADDAGWSDFGCYGNPSIRTSNIDRLARLGKKFNQAYLTTPQCSPSRTSLLTGQFAHTIRTEDLHTPLAPEYKIIPHYLKQKEYYTALLGKAHIGEDALAQFDFFGPGKGNPMVEDFEQVIDSAGDHPFFVWYAFSDPHRGYEKGAIENPHDPASVRVYPFLADTPETRQDLALYYDEITRMDQNIGRAVELLEKNKQLENTLILFLSDNGQPFTRAKGTLYDAGIKTPLIAVWPGKIEAGSEFNGLTSVIHLAPTLLDVAGVEKPETMYGHSILSVMTEGDKIEDAYVFSERNWHDCDEHMRSVRSDSFKLVYNAYIEWPHGTAADLAGSPSHQSLLKLKAEDKLKPEQMLVFQVPRPEIEFYDVVNDPEEFHNLAYDAAYRPLIQKHFKVLHEWMEDTDDFPPHYRRRYDNTDRVTGTHFRIGEPDSYNELPEEK